MKAEKQATFEFCLTHDGVVHNTVQNNPTYCPRGKIYSAATQTQQTIKNICKNMKKSTRLKEFFETEMPYKRQRCHAHTHTRAHVQIDFTIQLSATSSYSTFEPN